MYFCRKFEADLKKDRNAFILLQLSGAQNQRASIVERLTAFENEIEDEDELEYEVELCEPSTSQKTSSTRQKTNEILQSAGHVDSKLIRTGELNPFEQRRFDAANREKRPRKASALPPKVVRVDSQPLTDFEKYLLEQSTMKVKRIHHKDAEGPSKRKASVTIVSHHSEDLKGSAPKSNWKNQRLKSGSNHFDSKDPKFDFVHEEEKMLRKKKKEKLQPAKKRPKKNKEKSESSEEFSPSETEDEDEKFDRRRKNSSTRSEKEKDDGSDAVYKRRLEAYQKARLKERHERILNDEPESESEDEVELEGGLRIPERLWDRLYKYFHYIFIVYMFPKLKSQHGLACVFARGTSEMVY